MVDIGAQMRRPASGSWIYDPKIRAVVYQLVLVGLVGIRRVALALGRIAALALVTLDPKLFVDFLLAALHGLLLDFLKLAHDGVVFPVGSQ